MAVLSNAAIGCDSANVTSDGLALNAGLGYEVFLVKQDRRYLTDPDWPDEQEPGGALTRGDWRRGGLA